MIAEPAELILQTVSKKEIMASMDHSLIIPFTKNNIISSGALAWRNGYE